MCDDVAFFGNCESDDSDRILVLWKRTALFPFKMAVTEQLLTHQRHVFTKSLRMVHEVPKSPITFQAITKLQRFSTIQYENNNNPVTLTLAFNSVQTVTSKWDLVVKISQEFKRNIVHIKHVCWKFYKMKNRQNDSNNLVLIPTKPRFGVEREFCDVILHKCYFQQTCSILYSSWIPVKSSPPSLVSDVTRKSMTSSRVILAKKI